VGIGIEAGSPENRFHHNIIEGIHAGTVKGACSDAPPSGAFAFFFEKFSQWVSPTEAAIGALRGSFLDATNMVDGFPLPVYVKTSGLVLTGLPQFKTIPTNLAVLAIVDSVDVKLLGATLTQLDAGVSQAYSGNATHGNQAFRGILVADSSNISLDSVTLDKIRGRTAASHGSLLDRGGDVIGLHVHGAKGLTVDGLSFSDLTAGRGEASSSTGPDNVGGDAIGLLIEDSSSVAVHTVEGAGLTGGKWGSCQSCAGNKGGDAVGIRVVNSTGVTMKGARIEKLASGEGKPGNVRGLDIQGKSFVTVSNLLLPDVGDAAVAGGGGAGIVDGIRVEDSALTVSRSTLRKVSSKPSDTRLARATSVASFATLTLTSSILDNAATGPCVLGEGQVKPAINLKYSDLWQCAASGGTVTEVENLGVDPLFVAPAASDLALQPASPCIDKGDPADTAYDAEPPPNGCRVNMGHQGGTAEATAAAGAQQCQKGCSKPEECDDGNPCTDDACAAGKCSHTNNNGPCDDGDLCTGDGACVAGKCTKGAPAACDDGLACTTDSCQAGFGCVHAVQAGKCMIGGECYSDGDVAPGNPCTSCQPDVAQATWWFGDKLSCTLAHAAAGCSLGTCTVDKCHDGWADKNGKAEDGCETEDLGDIWVSQDNDGDPFADGSKLHPVGTIQEGIALAVPGNTIHVLPGIYQGTITLDLPYLALVGEGPVDEGIIGAPAQGNSVGVNLSADGITLKNLTVAGYGDGCGVDLLGKDTVAESVSVVGGATGIRVSGTASGATVRGCDVGGLSPKNRPFEGIVSSAAGTLFLNNRVHDAQGGYCDTFARYVGIECPAGCTVEANVVENLVAGLGPSVTTTCYTAGINAAQDPVVVKGNSLTGIQGHSGQSKPSNDWNILRCPGGNGYGISLHGPGGSVLTGNSLSGITGGSNGVNGCPEVLPGHGFGFRFEGSSFKGGAAFRQSIDTSNTLNGKPVYHLYKAAGVALDGPDLDYGIPFSPEAHLFIVESSAVSIKNLAVPASSEFQCDVCYNKFDPPRSGIAVVDSQTVSLEQLVVEEQRGNRAHIFGSPYVGPDPVAGIGVWNSKGVLLKDVLVKNAVGSAGVWGSLGFSPGGLGAALYVGKGSSVDLLEVEVAAAMGGEYARLGDTPVGPSGPASAIFVEGGSTVTADGLTLSGLGVPEGEPAGRIRGIEVYDGKLTMSHFLFEEGWNQAAGGVPSEFTVIYSKTSTTTVTKSTIDMSGLPAGAKALVLDGATGVFQQAKLDSCITEGAGLPLCFQKLSPDAVATLKVSDSLVHGCGDTIPGSLFTNVLTSDPSFVDLAGHDYHLQPTSPAIDLGKAVDGSWCLEPQPNGCRVDMGYYAGTAEATPKPGAQHCPCP
jgi:hypothetical protein